jgi:hypothetical protein
VRFVKHEGEPGWSVDVQESYIALSDTWVDGLAKVVKFAPENSDEFPDVGEMPEDVAKWFLFGTRRDTQHVPEYWEARRQFRERWAKRASPD